MKKTIILVVSVLLLLASIGTFAYLYCKNNEIEKEVLESKDKVKKLEDTINNEKTEINQKEDEYEKLKEKVKENLEELNIWEEMKENLNKSLS